MPELTDHHVEDLFADLRSAELHLVRPPGAGTARRTVRRRRINASVAVGVALASVTGVGIAELSNAATVDGKAAAAMSVRAQHVMEAMRVEAEAAIWTGPPMSAVEPLAGSSTLADDFTQAGDVLPGTYLVTMACAGIGAITVELGTGTARPERGAQPSGDVTYRREYVRCGGAMSTVTSTVSVPEPGYLHVDVRPDADTRGNAAFAYQARLSAQDAAHLKRQATLALEATPGGDVVSATVSGFSENGAGIPSPHFLPKAGTYRLEVACAGRGTLAPILGRRQISVLPITCRRTPTTETRTFVVEKADESLRPMLLTDVVGNFQAAAAFRVTRQ